MSTMGVYRYTYLPAMVSSGKVKFVNKKFQLDNNKGTAVCAENIVFMYIQSSSAES